MQAKKPVILNLIKMARTGAYRDMNFDSPDSVFFFKNTINFIGGMWDNI